MPNNRIYILISSLTAVMCAIMEERDVTLDPSEIVTLQY